MDKLSPNKSDRMPEGRQKLRPWLKRILEENRIKGVEWIDVDEGTFKILWPHKLKTNWAKENAEVFKEWARQTGRYNEGVTPEDYSTWKTNLRCALNKCPDIDFLGDGDQETGNDENKLPCRIYRMKSSVKTDKKKIEVQKLADSSPASVEGVDLEASYFGNNATMNSSDRPACVKVLDEHNAVVGNTKQGIDYIAAVDYGLNEINVSMSSLTLGGGNKLSIGDVVMNSETGEQEDFAALFPRDQPAPYDEDAATPQNVADIPVTVNGEADVTYIPLQEAAIGEMYQEQHLQLLMQQIEAGNFDLPEASGYPLAKVPPGLTDSLDLNFKLDSADMQSADLEYFEDLLDVAAKKI